MDNFAFKNSNIIIEELFWKRITNHFFKKKIPYNLTICNFRKWINYYQIQQFVYKNFVLENIFLMVSAIKEFIFLIRNGEDVGNIFSEKMIHDLLESHNFLKFDKKR